jgi:rubrerythrin
MRTARERAGNIRVERMAMSDVLIVESEKSCHVFCECGYVAMMVSAPKQCPRCNSTWENPRFEEQKHKSQE